MRKIVRGETFYGTTVSEDNMLVELCTFHGDVQLRGDDIIFRLNYLTNCEFAVTIFGQHCYVLMNSIEGFYGDAIRVLNSWNTVNDNEISQSRLGSADNHNDGIQIWNHNEDEWDVNNLTIKRNKLFLSEDSEVSTQGIIATDCSVSDSVFKGNIIDVDHWHGITLNESHNNVISWNVLNNTNQTGDRYPWIKVDSVQDSIHDNIVTSIIPQGTYDSQNHLLEYPLEVGR